MEMVSANSFFNVSEIFTPTVLWLILLLVVGVSGILSAILLYHWNRYALKKDVAKRVISFYFIISGIFILLMVGSLVFTLF